MAKTPKAARAAQPAPAPVQAEPVQAALAPAKAEPAPPVAAAAAPLADKFAEAKPSELSSTDVQRLDFDALISLAVEEVDAMDDGLSKSGSLADARAALNRARDLVEGVQTGRLA